MADFDTQPRTPKNGTGTTQGKDHANPFIVPPGSGAQVLKTYPLLVRSFP